MNSLQRLRELSLSEQEEYIARERALCRKSLFYFARTVLGFTKLTSSLHLPVCEFLQNPRATRKLILLPRGHYKTSCATLAYPMWLLIQEDLGRVPVSGKLSNPDVAPLIEDKSLYGLSGANLTMLIANETATGAEHFLSWIEVVIDTNPLFQLLFPELLPPSGVRKRWNAQEMLVPRRINRPEATIETIGVGGAVQGRHYRLQIKDDLIGKKAMESSEVMAKTIEWVDYADSLFVNPHKDLDIVVGTRWAEGDIYGRYLKDDRYTVFERKAIEDGKPVFPEEFSLEFFNTIAQRNPFYFRSQYQNDPRAAGSVELDPANLRRYTQRWNGPNELSLVIHNEDGTIEVVPVSRCVGVMALDPAREENVRHGSRKAILVCCRDWKGRTFVLDGWASRGTHDEMFDAVFRLAGFWNYPLGVETVAFQKFLIWVFRKECRRRRQWITVRELRTSTRKSKVERIRSALQNDLNLGYIYLPSEGITSRLREVITLLEDSMARFPDGTDMDLLDCLGYCMQMLQYEPFSEEEERMFREEEDQLLKERSALTGY